MIKICTHHFIFSKREYKDNLQVELWCCVKCGKNQTRYKEKG